jgi:hypothetical protein
VVFAPKHKASALEGALGISQQCGGAQDYADEEDLGAAGQHLACQLKGQVSRREPLATLLHWVEVCGSLLKQNQTISCDINKKILYVPDKQKIEFRKSTYA